jgi:putative tricarboxylic transport membrane protein
MNKKDLIASVIFLFLAVILYTIASTYPVKEGAYVVLNPGFYPKVLAVILGFLSFLLIFDSIKKQSEQEDCPPAQKKRLLKTRGGKLLVMTIFMLILYPFILEIIGFATAAFLFIFILILGLTENARSKIVKILAVSVFITGIMYLVFKVILRIPFPSGLLI